MRFFWILLCIFTPLFSHAEYINNFVADISVSKDSSFVVTEKIEYVFDTPRHGIFRYIPTTHPDNATHIYKERYTDIQLMSVSIDGVSVPYTVDDSQNQLFIKIGDPDVLITDTHTYEITYTVSGGVSYPLYGGADLYWNVTGNEWDVPIKHAEARVYSPDSIFKSESSCYKGVVGQSSSCNRIIEENGVKIFSVENLKPKEGITIAQSLDRTVIERIALERFKPLWIWPILVILFFGGLGVYVYRYKTAYKTERPIIAQYEPYSGMKPMYTGFFMDGRLDTRDITACIVYLAEQGFIKIRKTEKKVLFLFEVDDYEMTLVKALDDSVSTFERKVLEILFDSGPTVGSVISLHELKHDRSAQRANYAELQALKGELGVDLKQAGFFEHMPLLQLFMQAGVVVLIVLVSGLFSPETFGLAWFIGFNFAIGSLIVFYRRRTRKGYEVQDYLKGFRLFLNTTERDRYTFHNAPEKSPEQFMEYLPYAIAFGVEKKWAKVFEGITIPNPTWYDSGSVGAFSATNLTTSLGAFSTAFASSSGSSASSGGGSSGGGSGGGGGGSW